MLRVLAVEMKKLHSSKMWWMIAVGSVLPGIITYLSFLEQPHFTWLEFMHVAMLTYNVQSLLTFAAFAAFLCAREYEENTMEVTLCYPYPSHFFLIAKMIIMFLVIGITTILFAACTLALGAMLLPVPLQAELFRQFINVLLQLIVMHCLLVPGACFAAILSRMAISGIILGIVGMCLCMMLYSTNFIQYIPLCIPFVLSDHLLGMDVMSIRPNYLIHWSILAVYWVLLLFLSVKFPPNIHAAD